MAKINPAVVEWALKRSGETPKSLTSVSKRIDKWLDVYGGSGTSRFILRLMHIKSLTSISPMIIYDRSFCKNLWNATFPGDAVFRSASSVPIG